MPKPPSSGGEEEEKPRAEASEDLCEMALDPELLLLRDDGEEEFGVWWGDACGGRLPDWPQCRAVSPGRCGLAVPAPSSPRAFVAGAKLEDPEVRSVASNQSELEFSSLQDMVRPVVPLRPLTMLLSKAGQCLCRGILLPNDFWLLSIWQKTKCGSWLMEWHFIGPSISIRVNLSAVIWSRSTLGSCV